ncbi:MAG TPA: A/G-specific adenine glycosylase [Candidatus Kaiserbacteria bacterium]|nr:A/G-specific adenine glycosylase [Candidatus Kaiserbacteria bacterium]
MNKETVSQYAVQKGKPITISAFRQLVWRYYKAHGRHELPWRTTRNPYYILVSEIMLQQTQVERVIPFYSSFITQFPTIHQLARAPLSEVLTAWQGLGYNRRAKMLHTATITVVERYHGILPKNSTQLESLSGVGPYTARAIMTFAWNYEEIFIETNIRTVFLHHFFNGVTHLVSDKNIIKYISLTLPKKYPRQWYFALMDYGAYLKQQGVRINKYSVHYVIQKPFSGSLREVRGAIVRRLSHNSATQEMLLSLYGARRRAQSLRALEMLMSEKLVMKKGRYIVLSDASGLVSGANQE